jgi:hypothetical protein
MTIINQMLLLLQIWRRKMFVHRFRMLCQMTHAHTIRVKKIPIVRMGTDVVLPAAPLHAFVKFNQPLVIPYHLIPSQNYLLYTVIEIKE